MQENPVVAGFNLPLCPRLKPATTNKNFHVRTSQTTYLQIFYNVTIDYDNRLRRMKRVPPPRTRMINYRAAEVTARRSHVLGSYRMPKITSR